MILTIWFVAVVVTVNLMSEGLEQVGFILQLAAMSHTPGWLLEKVFLALFGVVHPLMMLTAFLFKV